MDKKANNRLISTVINNRFFGIKAFESNAVWLIELIDLNWAITCLPWSSNYVLSVALCCHFPDTTPTKQKNEPIFISFATLNAIAHKLLCHRRYQWTGSSANSARQCINGIHNTVQWPTHAAKIVRKWYETIWAFLFLAFNDEWSEPSFSIAYSFSPWRKWFFVMSSIRPTRSVVEIPSVLLTSLFNKDKSFFLLIIEIFFIEFLKEFQSNSKMDK